MGMSPQSQAPLPTWLDAAKHQYVRGQISIEEFEDVVDQLLWSGRADKVAPPPPPAGSMFPAPMVERIDS